MATIFFTALLCSLGATAFAVFMETFSEDKHRVGVGAWTFALTLCLNAFVLYIIQPYFSYLWVGGVPMLLFVNLGVVLLCSTVASIDGRVEDRYGTVWSWAVSVVVLVIWLVGLVFTPPMWDVVDNHSWDQMAGFLQVEEASEPRENSDLPNMLREAPETCINDAKTKLAGDLGTYLEINKTSIQEVNGHWYCITDFRVSNWKGLNERGGVIPGYLVKDIEQQGVPTEFRQGYQMRYVPTAGWQQDLERYVYQNYSLKSGLRVSGLDNLEVDDQWNPKYTGTLLKHKIGFRGQEVVGVLVVDPQTGQIEQYDLGEMPSWVNRVYPMDLVESWAEWWSTYANWDAQFGIQSSAGKRQVDEINDVVGPGKQLEYQITITSVGSDQSLTEILYVNPKTGKATRYPAEGKTLTKVDDLIQSESTRLKTTGYEPEECELQRLLGRDVWYCILTDQGGNDSGNSGSYGGVGFLQTRHTSDNTKVIVAASIEEGYRLLRQQIAREGQDNPDMQSEEAELIQVAGTIGRIGVVDSETDSYWIFTLRGEIVPDGLVFRVSGGNEVAALSQVGDRVIVTAYQLMTDTFTEVVSINNKSLPAFMN